MVNLNMIDTQGGGIKRMFQTQRRRFFPLPDYDLSQPERVVLTIRGRIMDERYTRILMERSDLDLGTIVLLDKVQKRYPVSREDHQQLKKAGLVEGRYPNLVVSAMVAAITGDKARHIRERGFNSRYYQDLLLELIREHQPVTREDIDRLLLDKLPEVLTESQKMDKIHNLLNSLARKQGKIRNVGSRRFPKWVRAETGLKKTVE